MNQLQVTISLSGLSNMGLQWHKAGSSFHTAINCAIERVFDRHVHNTDGGKHQSRVLYALGDSGAMWSNLPDTVCDALCNNIVQHSPRNSQTLCTALTGLAAMHTQWRELPTSVTAAVTAVLSSVDYVQSVTPADLSGTIHALGQMCALWEKLPHASLQQAVVRAAPMLSGQDVSDTLYGMACMDASWDSLTIDTQVALLQMISVAHFNMTEQVFLDYFHVYDASNLEFILFT